MTAIHQNEGFSDLDIWLLCLSTLETEHGNNREMHNVDAKRSVKQHVRFIIP